MADLVSNLAALDAREPYDVCIIGAGPAGIVLGTGLAEQGIRTLLIESGRSMADWLVRPALKQLAAYEFYGDTNYPLTRTTSRLIGGNSNFWTGRCERFQPSDFERHPYTPRDNPWPLRYADLEPFYERAERTLRVRGGRLSHHMPPRRQDLPLPPRTDISALKSLMADAGVTVDDSPTATPTRALRFFRTNHEILPRFLASRHATLVSGVTVTRLQHDDSGCVTGAEARTLDGQRRVARARVYVVCSGGLQTPRLLLLSRSAHFPDGLGNRFDRVGRGFNEHPAVNFYGRLPHNRHTLIPRHKVGRTHQFYHTFRPQGLGAVHPVFIQSWVFPHHLVSYRLRDLPRHALKILDRLRRATLHIGVTMEMKPRDENRVTLSTTRRDPLGDPLAHLTLNFAPEDRQLIEHSRRLVHRFFAGVGANDLEEIEVTFARHHVGACRMGSSPTTSVVGPDLRLHDSPNLYLCGCEVFPTGAALPPLLTITAFAHRLTDHLVERARHGLLDRAVAGRA